MGYFPSLGRDLLWYIVRIVPYSELIPDPVDPDQEDEDQWRVWMAMEGYAQRPLFKVCEDIRPWVVADDLIEKHNLSEEVVCWLVERSITDAVQHPDSPFGLGARFRREPASMVVLFHGQSYYRDTQGVLTEVPGVGRVPLWPTRHDYNTNVRAAIALMEVEDRRRLERERP